MRGFWNWNERAVEFLIFAVSHLAVTSSGTSVSRYTDWRRPVNQLRSHIRNVPPRREPSDPVIVFESQTDACISSIKEPCVWLRYSFTLGDPKQPVTRLMKGSFHPLLNVFLTKPTAVQANRDFFTSGRMVCHLEDFIFLVRAPNSKWRTFIFL